MEEDKTVRGHDREFWSDHGAKGGHKIAQERGPAYMSEIGKRGRAKQLANQTPGAPKAPAKSSGNAPTSVKRAPKIAAEVPNDPLLD